MEIPEEMMSDTIKAFADYLNYMAKSTNPQSAKGRGKGLLTKDGIKVNVKKKTKKIRVPRKKRTKTIFKETTQFEELVDSENLEETEATDEERRLNERHIGHVIGEGSSVIPETPDDQSDSSVSSLSGSDDEEGFLQTDEEELKDKSDDKRTETDNSDDDVGKKKAEKIQVLALELEKKKPEVPPLRPSQTLSSTEYGNQLLNDNFDILMHDILQDLVKTETQLMKLEKKVKAMSKIDHIEAIDKSVQAHLKKVLLKAVYDFGKIKQEKAAKKNMPKYSTKPFDEDYLKEYDQRNKLKKRHHNNEDPLIDAGKDTKKRRQKDSEACSSKIGKDQAESSKEDKAPSEPSKTEKFWMLKNQFKMMLWML
ncbi:hypothetical protein Tco_1561219 [Tanacetum coccineum]